MEKVEKELYINQEAFNRDILQEVEKINENRIVGRRSPSRTDQGEQQQQTMNAKSAMMIGKFLGSLADFCKQINQSLQSITNYNFKEFKNIVTKKYTKDGVSMLSKNFDKSPDHSNSKFHTDAKQLMKVEIVVINDKINHNIEKEIIDNNDGSYLQSKVRFDRHRCLFICQ